MARPAVDNGTGTQLLLCTSNWTAQLLESKHNDINIAEIPTTHMLSTAHTNIPGDLIDAGMISTDFHWNSDNPPPIGVQQTIILMNPATGTFTGTNVTVGSTTYTVQTSNPGFEQFTGFIKSYSKGIPIEGRMTGTINIRLSGPIAKGTQGATTAT